MVRDGDATGIDRFIVKQKEWFDIAYNEIYDGRKRSHWMWFIFPQLKDLGASSMAKFYGIEDEEEAKEYMSNDYLRCNLLKISEVLLGHKGRDIVDIMGDVDAMKLRSCMTLFGYVSSVICMPHSRSTCRPPNLSAPLLPNRERTTDPYVGHIMHHAHQERLLDVLEGGNTAELILNERGVIVILM